MALMGLKYMAWAKMLTEPTDAVPTYDTGLVIGKAVSVDMKINKAEGELYADDMLAEYAEEFSSGELDSEVDNISLENQALLYGATFTNNELGFGADDTAPYGGTGGMQVVMISGVKKYRAWFFPKTKAATPDWKGTTKNDSINFETQTMKQKILAPAFGKWYYAKEFDNEASAKAYIDTKLNVSTWYNVDVQVNGATGTEAATPSGTKSVAANGTFELTITGTVTALYDNGVDVAASIADGKYTIANIAANHTISVIF